MSNKIDIQEADEKIRQIVRDAGYEIIHQHEFVMDDDDYKVILDPLIFDRLATEALYAYGSNSFINTMNDQKNHIGKMFSIRPSSEWTRDDEVIVDIEYDPDSYATIKKSDLIFVRKVNSSEEPDSHTEESRFFHRHNGIYEFLIRNKNCRIYEWDSFTRSIRCEHKSYSLSEDLTYAVFVEYEEEFVQFTHRLQYGQYTISQPIPVSELDDYKCLYDFAIIEGSRHKKLTFNPETPAFSSYGYQIEEKK